MEEEAAGKAMGSFAWQQQPDKNPGYMYVWQSDKSSSGQGLFSIPITVLVWSISLGFFFLNNIKRETKKEKKERKRESRTHSFEFVINVLSRLNCTLHVSYISYYSYFRESMWKIKCWMLTTWYTPFSLSEFETDNVI